MKFHDHCRPDIVQPDVATEAKEDVSSHNLCIDSDMCCLHIPSRLYCNPAEWTNKKPQYAAATGKAL